ncbi:hypothetical protein M514_22041 [Trichuris suis]|uniref:Uncharacterized protein n=1 Tax=Trichuris suis TaxID=68888 RepID=A0A085N8N3_9BILA|nr:hypothetical protein M514_22041 [Trichuris suis]
MEKEISEWISSALDDPYDRGSKHGLMFPVHKELVRQTFTICETAVPVTARKQRRRKTFNWPTPTDHAVAPTEVATRIAAANAQSTDRKQKH